jgi:sugar phosphate isomerase/epimerase
MRLAVSNIAWRAEEAEAALDRLQFLGVAGLEIAPGLAFAGEPDPMLPGSAAIDRWRSALRRRGLTLVSMQSLLFGQAQAALFGDQAERQTFQSGIDAAIELAGRLGCPNLVLGSPTARRIPDGLDARVAQTIALDMIGRLGDRCQTKGVVLSLEPNPAAYGTNFLNTFDETLAFVHALGHPAVRINLDLGALILTGETSEVLAGLTDTVDWIGHIHISEPHLGLAPADETALVQILAALRRVGHDGWASIEMRSTEADNLERLTTSVRIAQAALQTSEGRVQ